MSEVVHDATPGIAYGGVGGSGGGNGGAGCVSGGLGGAGDSGGCGGTLDGQALVSPRLRRSKW